MVKDIGANDFNLLIKDSKKPILVDFWAPWCGPCRVIAPILEEISSEIQDLIEIVKINVDDNPELANKYGVISIPNMFLFSEEGEVLASRAGVSSKNDILAWIKNNI